MRTRRINERLQITDQGIWLVDDKPRPELTDKKGVKYVSVNSVDYQTHRWVAKFFVPNPDKLRFVNIIDKTKPLTSDNIEWVRGPRRSLDIKAVKEIRKMLKDPSVPMVDIASKFGVSVSTVSRIKSGERWS